ALDDFGAALFEFSVKRIEIGDPDVSVSGNLAPRYVGRGWSAGIRLSKMNFGCIAGDHRENGRIKKVAEDFEAEYVAVILRGGDHVRHDELWTNGSEFECWLC